MSLLLFLQLNSIFPRRSRPNLVIKQLRVSFKLMQRSIWVGTLWHGV